MTGRAARGGPLSRLTGPGSLSVVFALAGALVALNLVAFAFGEAPLGTLGRAFAGTWGTPYGIGQVLFKATPLILTGLAFEVALRAGLFNIGADGQVAMASLLGAWAASAIAPATPWPLALLCAVGVAATVGAGWALVSGIMRARLGVHEIISGIMLNRIADVLVPWVVGVLVGSSTLRTADVAPGATLPRLERFLPALSGSAASVAFPAAVALAFAVDYGLRRSRVGREMRWTGQNAEAARAEGIDVPRRLAGAMALSGALAGLAITATVLGYKGYFELGLGAGAGFTGIAVASLGRGRPLGIVLAAVLFGTLQQAGLAINARVPKEAMLVLEAVVIVLVAVAKRAAAPGAGSAAPAVAGAGGEEARA